MSELIAIELRQVDLALAAGVGTAVGTHRRRPLLLARVRTADGEGWGECGALESGTSVDPPLAHVRAVAVDLATQLCQQGATGVPPLLDGANGATRMAHSLFEMAMLDAALSATSTPLSQHVGAVRATVEVGAMVGIPGDRDPGSLLARVDAVVGPDASRARRLRLKIGPGWDVLPVRAVRERYPNLALQADANGAYSETSDGADGADRLRHLDPFELTCIEQPLPPNELDGHARLRHAISTPIALDESLSSVERVAAALQAEAMAVACLKPSRLGGLDAACRAQHLCTESGCRTFVGGLFESGLGRSANAALAARRGFDLPSDLTSPVDYLTAQPFGYPPVLDGTVSVPSTPGVGALADREVIERHTVWAESFGDPAT